MTVGLGLFTRYALTQQDALNPHSRTINRDYLRACTQRALNILTSGAAAQKLKQYIEVTNKHAGITRGQII